MGIAVIIPSISFANKNLGKVTLSGGLLESIYIGGPDYIYNTDDRASYFVYYTPNDTYQRGVFWSIESGSSYANINSATGEVVVLSGASSSLVTIKATSLRNSSIYATKQISVTYNNPNQVEYVASKASGGIPYITTINPASTYKYEMVFMLEDAIDQDIFGTRVSGSSSVLRVFGESTTSKFRVQKSAGSPISYDLDHIIQNGKKYRIVITNESSDGAKLYEINGSEETLLAKVGNMSASVSSSVPLMLCALNNNGTPVAYKNAKLRIYSFRIFTDNGNVLALKPYYDEQNSRPALIDELSDTVYAYQSTGTATLYYKTVGGTEESISINS